MDFAFLGQSAYHHRVRTGYLSDLVPHPEQTTGEAACSIYLQPNASEETKRQFALGWEIGRILYDEPHR